MGGLAVGVVAEWRAPTGLRTLRTSITRDPGERQEGISLTIGRGWSWANSHARPTVNPEFACFVSGC
jgi:hypothetical protein